MKFLCDEMLLRLGRWLRAAGYDTEIAEPGATDRSLMKKAVEEGRLMLSKDKKLREFKGAHGRLVLLQGSKMDECAEELTKKLGVDWLRKPFSRCLLCNAPLVPGGGKNWEVVPPNMRGKAYHCPRCEKPYWEGAHVWRMRAKLEGWAGLASAPKTCQQRAADVVPEAEERAGERGGRTEMEDG